MGNREDLLAGARKVIVERGIAKATARDIASAAGVSLAAIGYHFGSKDALITEALAESLGTGIGDGMEALIQEGSGMAPLAAFAQMWNAMPNIFRDNHEAMLASMENLVRASRSPESQKFFADGMPHIYQDMGNALRQAHPQLTAEQAHAIAQLHWVLVQGLGVLGVVAPAADLPDGDRLAEAITALTGA
ncbi:TetR/AcrR family transcriptional regulator [Nocardia sp. NPDC052566]|uniref:TetR/AcrR family transcriptional regulator n=1 Tax=Nocardia sp. NPDC052566 TaxID=3364330 RepID=UPI0037C7AE3A